MRFTGNFPKAVIERGIFPFETTKRDWLISITDKNCEDAVVKSQQFGRVLFRKFDDEEDVSNPNSITDNDADIIALFIQEAIEEEANVWVNCHAGICRSGAIVEILEALGWVIADNHQSPQRIRNRLVFNKLRCRFPALLNSWEV